MANSTLEVEDQKKQMREWLIANNHPSKDVSDVLVLRFLHSCYYDIEKTKKAAQLFFNIRDSIPDLLDNRDPISPNMEKAFKILNLAQLRISGNKNLWIWQLNDPGLNEYDYVTDAKIFLVSIDAWLLENTEMEEGDIVLMDVKDISLKFLTKFNYSVAKKLSKYQQEALPLRLSMVHIVNAPSFIDKLFTLIKPMLGKELTDSIHFHKPKSETLYKYINKNDLPEDYGGTNGVMSEHMEYVKKMMIKNRDKLNNKKLWTSPKNGTPVLSNNSSNETGSIGTKEILDMF